MSNTTQEEQILTALKNHKEGLHPTFFIRDLFIYQYNARINGLRKRFGCECKNGSTYCVAREHIKNIRQPDGSTLFFYVRTGENVDWEALRQEVKEKQSESYEFGLFEGR